MTDRPRVTPEAHRMADSNSFRDAVRRAAFGHFADDADQTAFDAAAKIIDRIDPNMSRSDRQRVANWTRGARNQWDKAQQWRDDGDTTTPWKPGVTDPSLEGDIAAYRYRALVQITDPDTGEVYSTVVLVDSTIPLSLDQIKDQALNTWLTIRGPDRHYIDRGAFGASSSGDVIVLSGGQRG